VISLLGLCSVPLLGEGGNNTYRRERIRNKLPCLEGELGGPEDAFHEILGHWKSPLRGEMGDYPWRRHHLFYEGGERKDTKYRGGRVTPWKGSHLREKGL